MMSTKNEQKNGKRYKLLKPENWALLSDKTYVAVETINGYAIRISEKGWIGLPKDHVEKNPSIFKLLKDGPKKSD
jgi:hypothetical protein